MAEKKDPVYASIEQTKAVYKRLGKSGLRVSVPILGAMSFGDEAWQPWVLSEDKVSVVYPGHVPSHLLNLAGIAYPQGGL